MFLYITVFPIILKTRNYEIACIGAGVDIYYHNDLPHPNIQDYKLYVLFNTYCLSKADTTPVIQ